MILKRLCLAIAALCLFAGAAHAQALNPARTGETYQRSTVQTGYKWFDDRKSQVRKNPDGTVAERPNYCDGCTFRDMTIRPGRYGFDFTRSRNVMLDNLTVEQSKPTTKEGDLPAGVKIGGGDFIEIRNSRFRRFKRDWPKADYGQGDGVDCDSRPSHVTITDSEATDNYDGGFDMKCNMTLRDLTSARNYRNYRFWGKFQTTGALKSIDPRDDHFWFSNGADGDIERVEITGQGGKTAFYFDHAGAEPRIKFCYVNTIDPVKAFGGRVPADIASRFHASCLPNATGFLENTIAEVPDVDGPVKWATSLDSDGDGIVVFSTKSATTRNAINKAAGLALTVKDRLYVADKERLQNRDGLFVYKLEP